MPKNILIFSDGTGQAGGLTPDERVSNVYKLYRATRVIPESSVNPAEQLAYYDAGLGSRPPSGGVVATVVTHGAQLPKPSDWIWANHQHSRLLRNADSALEARKTGFFYSGSAVARTRCVA
jgi:hypothetical protein